MSFDYWGKHISYFWENKSHVFGKTNLMFLGKHISYFWENTSHIFGKTNLIFLGQHISYLASKRLNIWNPEGNRL